MSFALNIKTEVLIHEYSSEQALALIRGLVSSAANQNNAYTIIKLNNNKISEIVRDLLEQLNIAWTFSLENKNWIVIENLNKVKEIKFPSQYFAGVFVGGGSISKTSSTSYHLELQIYSHIEAKKIQLFLNKYNFNFLLIQRRKLWVLYIKKSEQISDFLKAIQAFSNLLQFEDARIIRDFQNQLNRYSNLDMYNQQKLARSSEKFRKQYAYVKANNLVKQFKDSEITFFKLKEKNPYSSLFDLVDLLHKKGIIKTRSGLNHWIIKLNKVIKEHKGII